MQAFPKKLRKTNSPQKEKSKWAKKCLQAWSKVIRANAGYRCERCGKPARDAHHIIARQHGANMSWFNLYNGVALCASCHRFNGAHSVDFDQQVEFNNWVKSYIKRKGINYDTLKNICKARGRVTTEELKLLYKQLILDYERISH